MNYFKSILVGTVLIAGAFAIGQSQLSMSAVNTDYLVRSSDTVDQTLTSLDKPVTLSDWEYTARVRAAVCRFVQ